MPSNVVALLTNLAATVFITPPMSGPISQSGGVCFAE
jgi:hypothetical protein